MTSKNEKYDSEIYNIISESTKPLSIKEITTELQVRLNENLLHSYVSTRCRSLRAEGLIVKVISDSVRDFRYKLKV